jgi:hypothetical protein
VNVQKYVLTVAEERLLALTSRPGPAILVWEDNERRPERSCALSLTLTTSARTDAREPSQHPANHQTRRLLMSKEFEKLEALLYLSEPSEREPQVDRGEAAKLAARWGWLLHRAREQHVELAQMRRPDRGALGSG